MYCIKCNKNRKLKKSKMHCIWIKRLIFSMICNISDLNVEKIFKEEEPIEVLKILGLINNNANE